MLSNVEIFSATFSTLAGNKLKIQLAAILDDVEPVKTQIHN